MLLILCCFVAGKELNEGSQSTINGRDMKKSELTLVSYVPVRGVQKTWKGNKLSESCISLKTMGVNQTGYYLLNSKRIVLCDMSKNINDTDIQTQIGRIRFKDMM